MSSTKVRKCQVKEVSSGAGTKAQIPVLHAKIAADKSLEAATERITSAPQATTAKFEKTVEAKNRKCKEAYQELTQAHEIFTEVSESNKVQVSQFLDVMHGLSMQLKLLESKKVQQFASATVESTKQDLRKELRKL